MTLALFLVVLAVFALASLFFFARGRSASVKALSDLKEKTRPVDVAAFRNLIDPSEEDYLRANLSRGDFRSIRRERLLAAIEYLRCVSANAAVLVRLGEAARRSENPEIAKAAQDLVNSALILRLNVLAAEAKLYANILIPGLRLSPGTIASSYEKLTGTVTRLGLLQNYAHTGKIPATL